MLAWPYCHGWDKWKPPLLFALDMKLHELANLTKTIKNLQGGSAKRQALQMPQADLHEFAPSKLGDVGWADITWIAPCSWNRTGKMTDWTVSWRIAQGSVQSILKVCTRFAVSALICIKVLRLHRLPVLRNHPRPCGHASRSACSRWFERGVSCRAVLSFD